MKRQRGDSMPLSKDRDSTAASASQRFEDVVLCHADLVYRLANRLAGSVHEADDLVQETFLRAYRAYDRFELREYGAKPWLLKILHHVFYTRCGRAAREPTLLQDVNFDDFAAELEREPLPQLSAGQIDWDGFDQELKAAVGRLPAEYRSVLLLWGLGELSYKEIAAVLGCAMGTVMSRLYRARQMLGQSLAEYASQRGLPASLGHARDEAASESGAGPGYARGEPGSESGGNERN